MNREAAKPKESMEEEVRRLCGSVAEERLHNQATHFLPNSTTKRPRHPPPNDCFTSKHHHTLNLPDAHCLQPSVEPEEKQMEAIGLAARDLDDKTTNARHLQRRRTKSRNENSNPLDLRTIYCGSSWRRRSHFSLLLLFFGALFVLSPPAPVSAAKTDPSAGERIRWSIEDLDLSTDAEPKSDSLLHEQDVTALADRHALHIPDQLAAAGRLFQYHLHQQVDDHDRAFSHYKVMHARLSSINLAYIHVQYTQTCIHVHTPACISFL